MIITTYFAGFMMTFLGCALYNHDQHNKSAKPMTISMPSAFVASLLWPITWGFAVGVTMWNVLDIIYNAISKK